MKKILIISGLQIYPALSGGQKRTSSLCESLSNLGYQVSLYSLTGRKENYLKRKNSFEHNPYPHVSEYVNMNPIWGILGHLSYRFNLTFIWQTIILFFYTPKKLKNLISLSDTIICDFPFVVPAILKTSKKLTILNTHNLEFELAKGHFLKYLVKHLEQWAYTKVDHVFFCTQRESHYVLTKKNHLKDKIHILPNGVNPKVLEPYLQKTFKQKMRKELHISDDELVVIFSGSSYAPNIEVYEFLKEFSKTHRDILKTNNISIWAIGSVGNVSDNHETFHVTGPVPDIYPYLSVGDIGLNLVLSGSGSNVKNFEYLYFEIPILSSEFGARGLRGANKDGPVKIIERGELLNTLLSSKNWNLKSMAREALELNLDLAVMEKSLNKTLKTLSFA